jgi:hypothetical protein
MTTLTIDNNNMKYNLNMFREISFNGFNFTIPDDNVELINALAAQVGSQTYIRTPVFQKREHKEGDTAFSFGSSQSNFKLGGKKRKGNRNMEVNNDDWDTLRTFQATKMEQKVGFDLQIDNIRALLNKLSDKTFLDIRDNIMTKMDEIISSEDFNKDVADKISESIYDISTSNKFFSKIYADLYTALANKYVFMKELFFRKYENFKNEFKNIVFVDPNVNYDLFCDANKQNDKRKANTQFFVNLSINGFVSKASIVTLLKELLETINSMINQTDKKNEVDEITEHIAILYKKDIIEAVLGDAQLDEEDYEVDGDTIIETITTLAKSKAKDFKSLSNKSIFKYMDLIEM